MVAIKSETVPASNRGDRLNTFYSKISNSIDDIALAQVKLIATKKKAQWRNSCSVRRE